MLLDFNLLGFWQMTPAFIKTTSSSSTRNCYKKKKTNKFEAVVERPSADALLPLLPTADVLSEEAILKWYSDGPLTKGRSIFLEQMKKFVEWLKNAEEGKSPSASDGRTRRRRKGLVFISTQDSLCSMSHSVYTERPRPERLHEDVQSLFILSTCLESWLVFLLFQTCLCSKVQKVYLTADHLLQNGTLRLNKQNSHIAVGFISHLKSRKEPGENVCVSFRDKKINLLAPLTSGSD